MYMYIITIIIIIIEYNTKFLAATESGQRVGKCLVCSNRHCIHLPIGIPNQRGVNVGAIREDCIVATFKISETFPDTVSLGQGVGADWERSDGATWIVVPDTEGIGYIDFNVEG